MKSGALARIAVILASAALASVAATNQPPFLFADEQGGRVVKFDETGSVVWSHTVQMARDAWLLPNGNVLASFNEDYRGDRNDRPGGVVEVTPDGREVFRFATTGQVFSCQRLADGTTLVGAASQARLLIVDAQTNVVRAIPVRSAGGHSCMRYARALPGGGFIVAEESAKAVREYAADGTPAREITVDFPPFAVVRLTNGNTVISGRTSIVEVDPAGRETWRLNASDVPALGIRWFAGFQVMPGGNLFVCNAGGKVGFFAVTRDAAKRVVWQSSGAVAMGHAVQRLDVPPGGALR